MKKTRSRPVSKTGKLRTLSDKAVRAADKPVADSRKAPAAEEWLVKDPETLARVRKGLAQAAAGQIHDLGSFARYAGQQITATQRRRLEAGIKGHIRLHQQCLGLVPSLDADVYQAGMEVFATEGALALWLCAPAQAFSGKLPIRVARTVEGRKEVANLLRGLAHGMFA